jgi:hypothetical protein
MAANTERDGYLTDSHENSLFQKQTDRQTSHPAEPQRLTNAPMVWDMKK